MRDPYRILGRELAAAAERQRSRSPERRRRWFPRRLHAFAVAAVLILGGGAVTLAATGVLSGSPVKQEVPPNAAAGNGLPVAGASGRLVQLSAADPGGGLPWGMRVERTSRGQLCLQVGRVDGGQLGELGLDSAFGNDGRFHPLPPTVLPPGYGGSADQVECVPDGGTVIFEDLNADRSGVRLLPAEFRGPPLKHPGEAPTGVPPVGDLRALAYGVLGPHAVSVTYRTLTGTRTIPVSGPDGGFLIVAPAGYIKSNDTIGGSVSGTAEPSSVDVGLAADRHGPPRIITAATFRFLGELCSQGVGAPVTRSCPMLTISVPRHPHIRRLDEPVRLTLLAQSHAECNAAYLKFPCYKGQVEFTAPYAVKSAGSEYEIDGIARCKIGGRVETSWSLERDVKAHELVRTNSLGRFVYAPSCASTEKFQVSYQKRPGPLAAGPPERVIVGEVSLRQAALRGGGRPSAPE